MALEGASSTTIAQELGFSAPTISRIMNSTGVRDLVKKVHEKFITDNLEVAAQNLTQVISSDREEDLGDKRKYSTKVLESVGILSGAQAPMTVNVLNTGDIHISPIVQALVRSVFGDTLMAPDPLPEVPNGGKKGKGKGKGEKGKGGSNGG